MKTRFQPPLGRRTISAVVLLSLLGAFTLVSAQVQANSHVNSHANSHAHPHSHSQSHSHGHSSNGPHSLAPQRRPLTPEQAREARQKGQVQSLRSVLKQTLSQFPGQLLKAELHHDDEQWIYTLVILQEGGYLTKIWVDAQEGTVLQYKSRKKHKHRSHHENSRR